MNDLIWLSIVIIIVLIIWIIGYLLANLHTYRKIKKQEEKEYGFDKNNSKSTIPSGILSEIRTLIQQKYAYIRNYHIFTLFSRVFDLGSIVFSTIGMIYAIAEMVKKPNCMTITTFIISFLSVIFVLIALYVMPKSRFREAIKAWREASLLMGTVNAKKGLYEMIGKLHDADIFDGKNDNERKYKCEIDKEIDKIDKKLQIISLDEKKEHQKKAIQKLAGCKKTMKRIKDIEKEVDNLKDEIVKLLAMTEARSRDVDRFFIVANEVNKINNALYDIECSLTTDEE